MRLCVLTAAAVLAAAFAAATGTAAPLHGGTTTNVVVLDPNGHRIGAATRNREGDEDALAYDPSWAPDGRRLVFAETACHYCESKIHVVGWPPSGRWLTRPLVAGFHPRWSPDGRRIAYVATGGGIYVLGLATGARPRLVVSGGLGVGDPTWAPDGRRLAFSLQQTATTWRIGVVGADGRGRRLLTRAGQAVEPAWAPDGRRIAFARQDPRTRRWQIWSIGAAGGALRRIGGSRGSDTEPAWSPDGQRLAFVRSSAFGSAVYTMDVSGRHVRRLTPADGKALQPAWSPDGRRLAVVEQHLD